MAAICGNASGVMKGCVLIYADGVLEWDFPCAHWWGGGVYHWTCVGACGVTVASMESRRPLTPDVRGHEVSAGASCYLICPRSALEAQSSADSTASGAERLLWNHDAHFNHLSN